MLGARASTVSAPASAASGRARVEHWHSGTPAQAPQPRHVTLVAGRRRRACAAACAHERHFVPPRRERLKGRNVERPGRLDVVEQAGEKRMALAPLILNDSSAMRERRRDHPWNRSRTSASVDRCEPSSQAYGPSGTPTHGRRASKHAEPASRLSPLCIGRQHFAQDLRATRDQGIPRPAHQLNLGTRAHNRDCRSSTHAGGCGPFAVPFRARYGPFAVSRPPNSREHKRTRSRDAPASSGIFACVRCCSRFL
jgi:hypothetical protein